MSRRKARKIARNHARIRSLRPLAGLLATGLTVPALAQSVPFPTYTTGPLSNGSWLSSG